MFELTLDTYAHSNKLRNVNPYFKVLFTIVTMLVSLISTSPIVPLTIFIFFTFLKSIALKSSSGVIKTSASEPFKAAYKSLFKTPNLDSISSM
jgi:cobalt/nickel transport system permease protein